MDADLMRHALKVAHNRGFAEVELKDEGGSFSARIDHASIAKGQSGVKRAFGAAEHSEDSAIAEIRSSLVGYYREASDPLRVGRVVSKGEIVAVVAALGIANDIESNVSGEILEVLVRPDQPVEYGQPLAKVRTQ